MATLNNENQDIYVESCGPGEGLEAALQQLSPGALAKVLVPSEDMEYQIEPWFDSISTSFGSLLAPFDVEEVLDVESELELAL